VKSRVNCPWTRLAPFPTGALAAYNLSAGLSTKTSPQVVVGLPVAGMAVGDYCAGGGNTDAIRLSAVICQVTNIQLTDGIQTVRGVFALVIVLLIGAGFAGFLLLITYSWRQVVAYARTGHMPGSEAEGPGT